MINKVYVMERTIGIMYWLIIAIGAMNVLMMYHMFNEQTKPGVTWTCPSPLIKRSGSMWVMACPMKHEK